MTRRAYHSDVRARGAEATRQAILEVARVQFEERGIDRVTIADLATAAGVGTSTVYATFLSKEGILRALMQDALFGSAYRDAVARLEGEDDPVELIRRTAAVARAVYQGEDSTLGLLRGAAAFAPSLRTLEEEFDTLRYRMQEARVVSLHAAGRLAPTLSLEDGRRILWTLTSREVYRCLVVVAGWAPDRYEAWLADTLLAQLVVPEPPPQGDRMSDPRVLAPTIPAGEKFKGPASYFPSIEKTYGRPIQEWLDLTVERLKTERHMEVVTWLKQTHGMGHGHANAVVGFVRAKLE